MAFFIGGAAGAAIAGGVASAVVGGALGRSANRSASRANNAAADATALQAEIARDQWDRYREIYEPMERGLVADANKADAPEAYERAASEASATVSQQFGKARERLQRTPGMDPSSGAYQAGMTGLNLAQAATDATQQNAARVNTKDTAYRKKMAAVGLGKGLDGTAASGLQASASNNLTMAQSSRDQANQIAGAAGRVSDRIFNSPSTSNWLGNVGTSMRYGTNIGSQQTNMLQDQDSWFLQ